MITCQAGKWPPRPRSRSLSGLFAPTSIFLCGGGELGVVFPVRGQAAIDTHEGTLLTYNRWSLLTVLVNMAKKIFLEEFPTAALMLTVTSASHCSRVSFWCLPHFSGGFQCGFNHPLHCCAYFIFSFPFFVLNLAKVCLLEVSQEQNSFFPAFSQPEEQNELWIGLLFCKWSITLVYLLGVCGCGACK